MAEYGGRCEELERAVHPLSAFAAGSMANDRLWSYRRVVATASFYRRLSDRCFHRAPILPYFPCSLHFPEGFPVLVTNTGIPQFTFFDEGQATATRFERFLKQYQPLFEALGEFELVFVANTDSSSARATATFNRFLPADRLRGVTSATPLGVEHFLEYLTASQRYEAKGSVTTARDLEVLREGEHLYTSLEQALLHSRPSSLWSRGRQPVYRL